VRARTGDADVPPRTQPSIAVSADGARWSIVNASPDVREQLARFPGLHPRPGTRDDGGRQRAALADPPRNRSASHNFTWR
jgi:hypothetical protein